MAKSGDEISRLKSRRAQSSLRNDDGVAVDAIPFLVVSSTGSLVSFSFGPMYGMALGWSFERAVAASAVVCAVIGVGAHVRFARQAHREVREKIPPTRQLLRLFYAALAFVVLMFALTLPFL